MRRRARAAWSAVLAATLAAGGLAAVTPPAAALSRPAVASPLSAVPGATWQTDGTVSALAHSAGVLYAGGTFSSVRPPGTAPGAEGEVRQAYLAAFRTSDMSLIAQWRPALSGPAGSGGAVQALEVSPDGRRLYVGGDFTSVDGVPRSKVAAFDLTDPTAPRLLDGQQFAAATSGRVYALAATDTTLYVGGTFSAAGGAARTQVAAFAATSGTLLPWRVDLAGAAAGSATTVNALEAAGGRVYVGGMFDTAHGASSHGLVAVDPVTGARDEAFVTPAMLRSSYVTTLLVSGGTLYLAGRDDSPDLARLEGVMAVRADTGEVRWGQDGRRCLGDSFALADVAGAVWVGTHAHDCSAEALGGHPEDSFPDKAVPRFYASVLGHDPTTGELRHFFPDTTGSASVPGSQDNVRALATDGNRLFVAGGWQKVNGVEQQNLTTFSPRTLVPSEAPLRQPVTATADSTGRVVVSWTTTSDRDDRVLTYSLHRGAETTPLLSRTVPSAFWDRQTTTFVDTALAPGTRATYRLVVSDGTTAVTSTTPTAATAGAGATAYDQAVLRDAPAVHWRLDDPAGSTAVTDSSGRGVQASPSGAVRLGQAGALSTGATSAAFSGGGIASASRFPLSDAHSVELWLRTTTTRGGKLLGFGNVRTGLSGLFDRHLYMTDGGRLVYGTFPGTHRVLPTPGSYNDGQWRHVVATQDAQGTRLYVDGSLVASTTLTGAQAFGGYLRVGGDDLRSWPMQPTSNTFAGDIDEVAYYTHALRPEQIAQHRALGAGSRPAAVTAAATDLGQTPVRTEVSGSVTAVAATDLTLTSVSTTAPFSAGALPAQRSYRRGEPVQLPVRFSPTVPGRVTGALKVVTSAGEALLELRGRGTQPGIAASPPALDFAQVPVGLSRTLVVDLENAGSTAETFGAVTAPGAPYAVTGLPAQGAVLAPGASLQVTVTALPRELGASSAALTLTSTSGPVTVPLRIDAVRAQARLELAPSSLDFGDVITGTSVTRTLDIANTGNISLSLDRAAMPTGAFAAADTLSAGQVLTPGDKFQQALTFTPTTPGPFTATYEISSDDGRGTQRVVLTGRGVEDPVRVRYVQAGGAAGPLGDPLTPVTGVPGGGRVQDFRNGSIWWSPSTGARIVAAVALADYRRLGGPTSALGFPTTDTLGTPDGVGRYNHFTGGSLYWSPATGGRALHGAIRDAWARTGWEAGPLGYPTTDELGVPGGPGRYNHFSKAGSVYWSPTTGAHAVYGAIREAWARTGWEAGPLGYPTTDESGVPAGPARYNHFSGSGGASVYWSPTTGAHAVYGAIRAAWAATGWESGRLGLPVRDEYAVPGGRRSDFVRGSLTWKPLTGVRG